MFKVYVVFPAIMGETTGFCWSHSLYRKMIGGRGDITCIILFYLLSDLLFRDMQKSQHTHTHWKKIFIALNAHDTYWWLSSASSSLLYPSSLSLQLWAWDEAGQHLLCWRAWELHKTGWLFCNADCINCIIFKGGKQNKIHPHGNLSFFLHATFHCQKYTAHSILPFQILYLTSFCWLHNLH